MSETVTLTIPHKLTRAEARQRFSIIEKSSAVIADMTL